MNTYSCQKCLITLTVSLGVHFIVKMYIMILTRWIFIVDDIHFEKIITDISTFRV